VSAPEFLKKADSALVSASEILTLATATELPVGYITRCSTLPGQRSKVLATRRTVDTRRSSRRFGRHFCRDGPLPSELGRAINEAQELRVEGDYGSGTPDPSEVAAYLVKAEAFVAAGQNDHGRAVSISWLTLSCIS
jgi:hypothetical protein